MLSLEQRVADRLRRCGQTLAVAESCSGGLLAHRLTNIPGSSAFFKLGVVAYSNEAKIRLLNIPREIIQRHGAVEACVAELMAQNVRRIVPSDFGVGVTGVAGPGGGTESKPIGLVYVAVAGATKCLSRKYYFQGDRLEIKHQSGSEALKILLEF